MGNATEGSASKGAAPMCTPTTIVLPGRFSDPPRISARVNEKGRLALPTPPNRGRPFHVRILNSLRRKMEKEGKNKGTLCARVCRNPRNLIDRIVPRNANRVNSRESSAISEGASCLFVSDTHHCV